MQQEVKTPDTPDPVETPAPPARPYAGLRRWAARLAWGLAGFASAAALCTGLLIWRLSAGPLDAHNAIPVLEGLIGNNDRMRLQIGALILSNHGASDPLALEMENVRLLGPHGEFMTIRRIDMGVSPWRLALGRLHFTYAKTQNLSLRLIRLPDGSVTLTGLDTGQKDEQSVALRMDNIVHDLPSIGRLTLADTRVVFEDQKDAYIRRFDDVNVELAQDDGFSGRSVSGYLTMTLSGFNDGSHATFDFIYDAADKTLTANASLNNADTRKLFGGIMRAANLPIIDMLVQGRAEITLNNDFSPTALSLHLKGDDGMVHWPRNYGSGLEDQKLTKYELDLGLDPKTRALTLSNATITIKGVTLTLTGTLSAANGWDNLTGQLTAAIPVVAVDVLPAIWPAVWDSGGRHWLVDRMDKGRFTAINVAVPFTAARRVLEKEATDTTAEPEYTWDIKTGTIKGTFGFTGVSVDYREPMLPAKNVTGTGLYEGLSLTLDFTRADIGKLKVGKGSLFFDDLITAGTGKADLALTINGPVAAVFDYLDREPISYRKKVSIDGSKATGTADVDLKVGFPTTKDMRVEDVHVAANAKIHNLLMADAVKGLTLSGPAFDLEASENHFKISGTGALDGQPATLMWQEVFSPKPTDPLSAQLQADIKTDKNIRSKFIGSLETRVDGTIPAKIAMLTKPDGSSKLDVTATLDQARIDFTNPFNAVKDAGAPATATLSASLQNGMIQSIDTLAVKGAGVNIASGNITFARDKNNDPVLSTATLKGLKLGTNDADLIASWKGENDITAKVTGNSFDARAIMGNTGKDTKTQSTASIPQAYDVTLKTGKLYVGDTPLENVSASFVAGAGGIVRMAQLDAQAGGKAVTLRYGATGGTGDRLIWEAEDAGAALAAMGITDRVRGGHLRVEGAPLPKGQAGDMQGKLFIENFSVVKAPMLAKLVNLLSLPGLLNILSQDTGLKFDRAESGLTVLNRAGGQIIQFADGRTSGASLGLTFEGEVNTATDKLAIQGTAIPLSQINGLVASIPLVGTLLTGGGKGSGIFAATYTMKGATSDPDVSINPLSVLTPGILRRILFEGALGSTTAKDK